MADQMGDDDDNRSDYSELTALSESTRDDPGDTQSVYSGAAGTAAPTASRPKTRYSQRILTFGV